MRKQLLIAAAAAALGLTLNLPTPNLPTPEHVGPVGNGRGDEEERRWRKIEVILESLRRKPGRVSEEAVERLAKRTGLDLYWDGKLGEPRMLSIAGTGVLLDVSGFILEAKACIITNGMVDQLRPRRRDKGGHLLPHLSGSRAKSRSTRFKDSPKEP